MTIGDATSGLLAALIGVAVVVEALTFPPMPGQPIGPAVFPSIVGAGLIVAGAVLIVTSMRRRTATADALRDGTRPTLNFALVLVGLLFYAFAVNRLGFLLTAAVFLSVLFLAFGVRRARILPIAIAVTLVVHYAFYTLLRVPLPWGVLEGLAW